MTDRIPVVENSILVGDCIEVLQRFPSDVFSSVISDPPFGLEFMQGVIDWDAPWKTNWQSGGGFSKPGIGDRETPWPSFSATSRFVAANPTCGKCGGRARGAKKCLCETPEWKPIGKRKNPENEGLPDDVTGGGMARHMQAFQDWCEVWAVEVLRVLKPGGHALIFGGERTYHRLACGLENAGFEVRNTLGWVFATGFPKSQDVSRKLEGELAKKWDGWGTALKPSYSPILLLRKPIMTTVAASVLKHGTGALNIGGCKVDLEDGSEPRWPANILHDGSSEAVESLGTAARFLYCPKASKSERNAGLDEFEEVVTDVLARHRSRRMEEMKRPDGAEPAKGRNHHPCVKPVILLKWLCRLITPSGGLILDPFFGSGSTGIAAVLEGFKFIGIERDESYAEIARARIDHWSKK